MNKIKVLSLSWQPMLLFTLLSLFSDDPVISLETKNFAGFLKQNTIEKINYNILLLDDAFSNRDEYTIIDNFLCNNDIEKKIIFTGHHEIGHINKMIKCGVKGIVSKYASEEKLREAIIRVDKNEKYFCDKILNVLYTEAGHYDILTPREKEIVFFMKESLSNKEIAEKLFISVKTVERHKEEIKNRLGVKCVKEILQVLNI